MTDTVLSIRGLTASFPTSRGEAAAVAGVDLDLRAGEMLGLVGESGSGKSVTLRAILGLVRPPVRIAGQVLWQGRDLLTLPPAALRRVRGGEIATIFQEPMTALNPVLPIGLQIDESLRAHTSLGRRARHDRARELLDLVGIPAAAKRLDDYPHQFSGGMRQRAMIAIALASEPQLLLADEPTTALDVTIQDQILTLLLQLRDRLGMSVILVTHDLGVVAQSCDRMAVMYAGRVVETGPVADVFRQPRHAYTLGLLNSVPRGDGPRQPLQSIEGSPPSLTDRPPGCAFAPRCAFATPHCRAELPALLPIGPDAAVACFETERVAAARGAA
jgi:peptide/nickel transport system ATP-binding protein/oligopeptide transport system ATP-binding protein